MSDQPSNSPAPPAARPSAPRPARPTRPGVAGFLAGLIGGLVVAALAVGAAVEEWPALRDQLTGPQQATEAAIQALAARVAALEAASGKPAAPDPRIAELGQRIATLEQAPRGPAEDPRVAALTDKTNALADQVAALHAASGDAAEMEREVARAEAAAQSAQNSAARRQSAEALLLASGQLRDAIERGGPYAVELAAARKVAPPSVTAALDALAPSADSGIARLGTLADQFPDIAAAIARAAIGPGDGDDLWSRIEREAAKLVSIRRVDGAGDDAMAAAARAEKALKAGSLAEAVRNLQSLTGDAAEAAKPWLKSAQARLNAERALADLAAATSAALAAGNG